MPGTVSARLGTMGTGSRSNRERALEAALIRAVMVLRGAPKSEDGKTQYLAVAAGLVQDIAEQAAAAINQGPD